MKNHGEEISEDQLNALAATLLSGKDDETWAEDLLDFEVTDPSEKLSEELRDELFQLGGLTEEDHTLLNGRIIAVREKIRTLPDGCIVAKVVFSSGLHRMMCALERLDADNVVSNLRADVRNLLEDISDPNKVVRVVVLKGKQNGDKPGFAIFGGRHAENVDLQWREDVYANSKSADHFKELSNGAEQTFDFSEEREAQENLTQGRMAG